MSLITILGWQHRKNYTGNRVLRQPTKSVTAMSCNNREGWFEKVERGKNRPENVGGTSGVDLGMWPAPALMRLLKNNTSD